MKQRHVRNLFIWSGSAFTLVMGHAEAHAAGIGRGVTCDPPRYTVTDLGVVPGTQFMSPHALNESGVVVGSSCSFLCTSSEAFVWSDGDLIELQSFGGQLNSAMDVDDFGNVVGTSFNGSVVPRASIWFEGSITPLPEFENENSYAYGINNSGVIIGMSDNLMKPVVWVLLDEPGWYVIQELPDLMPVQQTFLQDINNAGQIVGHEAVFQGATPQLWTPSGEYTWTRETLPGGLTANAINESGTMIVGTIDHPPTDSMHAAVWTWSGSAWQILDLGTIVPEGNVSEALDVNDQGQIVGVSATNHASDDRAILHEDGMMHDLNSLIPADSGWVLTSASAINESGWITGTGMLNGEHGHAFLLKPAIYSAGDVNVDGHVGIADLLAVIGAWGICPPPTPKDPGCCPADVTNDGGVGIADMLLVIATWG